MLLLWAFDRCLMSFFDIQFVCSGTLKDVMHDTIKTSNWENWKESNHLWVCEPHLKIYLSTHNIVILFSLNNLFLFVKSTNNVNIGQIIVELFHFLSDFLLLLNYILAFIHLAICSVCLMPAQ